MSGIETAANVQETYADSQMFGETQQLEVESLADSAFSLSWNTVEKREPKLATESTIPEQEAIERFAANMVKLAAPLTTSAIKNTHIEERLMRNRIKFHETVRQLLILVEVFKDSVTDPSWMAGKLLYELQDFLEVDRLRMGCRGLSFEVRQQLEIAKIKLILQSVIACAEHDTTSFPAKNVVYFTEVEAAYLKFLVPGETFQQVAKKISQLDQNQIPLYNTQPVSAWTWSTSEGRYLPGSA